MVGELLKAYVNSVTLMEVWLKLISAIAKNQLPNRLTELLHQLPLIK